MVAGNRILTSVGYTFAFAALCGMSLSAPAAYADETDSAGSEASGDKKVSNQASNAPVPKEKDETVYVYTTPDGTVKSTEVTSKLKNGKGSGELADSSSLREIADEDNGTQYTGWGSHMVWNAGGEDVTYKGISKKDAPISIAVSYKLDGKSVEPADLAGASGKLTIRYDFTNNATVKADINGTQETLYVPFTVITAMMFDADKATDVKVSSGRVVDDEDRLIVAGFATPGLATSLGKMADDYDLPDHFEVTANVTDFEMKTSLTIATPELLSSIDTKDFEFDELEEMSDGLSEAMGEILDGAGQFASGLEQLAKGVKSAKTACGDLADGAKSLSKGSSDLAKGAKQLNKEAKSLPEGISALADGSATLAEGLGKTVEGADALAAGVDELAPGISDAASAAAKLTEAALGIHEGTNTVKGTLETLAAAADALAAGLTSQDVADLVELAQGAQAEMDAYNGTVESLKTSAENAKSNADAASSAIGEATSAIEGIDETLLDDSGKQALSDTKAALETAAGAATSASEGADEVAGLAESASTAQTQAAAGAFGAVDFTELQEGATAVSEGISGVAAGMGDESDAETLVGGSNALAEGMAALTEGLDGASEGMSGIQEGMQSFTDAKEGLPAVAGGAQDLSDGLAEVSENAPQLVEGISQIAKGTKELASGTREYADGVDEFAGAMSQLSSGTNAAASGGNELAGGLQQFNDEGISEITDRIDNDLLPFTKRFDALVEAGKAYDNFSGITEGTSGTVKFIYETDPIELAEESEQ